MGETKAPERSRVERRKEETKQKIVTVAMHLFMQQGIDATTMEQIAEQVDIAKGTLYNYFPVKEAIIDAYVKKSFKERNPERIARLLKLPDTRTRLIQLLSELMEGVQAQKEIFEKYFSYRIKNMIALSQDEGAQSGLIVLENEIVESGQKSGELRSDLPLDILVDLIEFVFIEVAQKFYMEPEQFKANEAIERYVDLFMNGAKS